MDTRLFIISAAARAVGCSERTLRVYADRGIIKPIRDSSSRRLFNTADIDAARKYFNQHKKWTKHHA